MRDCAAFRRLLQPVHYRNPITGGAWAAHLPYPGWCAKLAFLTMSPRRVTSTPRLEVRARLKHALDAV